MDGLIIQWLATAQEDLRAIRTYYMDNAGKRVMHNRIKKIVDSVSLLSNNPYLGKEEQKFVGRSQQYRFLVCGDYKVYYYIRDNKVKIALLWDCRQNPLRLSDRLK